MGPFFRTLCPFPTTFLSQPNKRKCWGFQKDSLSISLSIFPEPNRALILNRRRDGRYIRIRRYVGWTKRNKFVLRICQQDVNQCERTT